MSLNNILEQTKETAYRPELNKILGIERGSEKQGMSEGRLRAAMPDLRRQIAFWREYPDQFVEFMAGPNSRFKLYNYQRIMLRVSMRHRNSLMVLPRGSSKSFLTMLILVIKCILFPGVHLAVTTGGKQY